VKRSRIKRLIPKKLAQRLARTGDTSVREELARYAEREAGETIAKMRAKGFRLVTRLESGEGVFVRDDDVVGLHIQLPSALYKRLETECRSRETTKRNLVIAALERYLAGGEE
jgi:putative heme iron utilization protein